MKTDRLLLFAALLGILADVIFLSGYLIDIITSVSDGTKVSLNTPIALLITMGALFYYGWFACSWYAVTKFALDLVDKWKSGTQLPRSSPSGDDQITNASWKMTHAIGVLLFPIGYAWFLVTGFTLFPGSGFVFFGALIACSVFSVVTSFLFSLSVNSIVAVLNVEVDMFKQLASKGGAPSARNRLK